MKYLKLFENYDSDGKLEDFCKEHIVALLDDGYDITIRRHPGRYTTIYLNRPDSNDSRYPSNFKWDDVKEDFIQFTEMLNEYYTISDLCIGNGYEFMFLNYQNGTPTGVDYYKYEDIINDNIPENKAKVSDINKWITEPISADLDNLSSVAIIIETNY